jgi:hypothetical protein
MRMPRPPPPKAALTSTGVPISAAAAFSCPASGSLSLPKTAPGRTGTPAWRISSLAAIFDPIASMAAGVGPTNVIPAAAHCRAKPAFSDRKP